MHGLHEEHGVTGLGDQPRYARNVQVRAFGSEKKLRVEIHRQNNFLRAVPLIHFQEAAGQFVFDFVEPQRLLNFGGVGQAHGRIISHGRVNIFRVEGNGDFDVIHSDSQSRRGNRRVPEVAGNIIGQKTFGVGDVENIFHGAERVRAFDVLNLNHVEGVQSEIGVRPEIKFVHGRGKFFRGRDAPDNLAHVLTSKQIQKSFGRNAARLDKTLRQKNRVDVIRPAAVAPVTDGVALVNQVRA